MIYDSSIDMNNVGSQVSGIDTIRQSWSNILDTVPGSDPMRPTFGSGIYDYLDKNLSSVKGAVIAKIISDLETWESRATISQADMAIVGNQIKINIQGIYTATNTQIAVTITLTNISAQPDATLMRSYSNAYNKLQYD